MSETSQSLKTSQKAFLHNYIKGTNTQGTPVRSNIVIGAYPSADLASRLLHLLKGRSEYNTKCGITGAVSIATTDGLYDNER